MLPKSPLMRAATIEHEIQTLIEPLVADFGAEVFDVTWGNGRLKVAVDALGGIDTTTLSQGVLHDFAGVGSARPY